MMHPMKSYLSEFIGTALLLAVVAGSGIMGETLGAGNAAVAYLAIVLPPERASMC